MITPEREGIDTHLKDIDFLDHALKSKLYKAGVQTIKDLLFLFPKQLMELTPGIIGSLQEDTDSIITGYLVEHEFRDSDRHHQLTIEQWMICPTRRYEANAHLRLKVARFHFTQLCKGYAWRSEQLQRWKSCDCIAVAGKVQIHPRWGNEIKVPYSIAALAEGDDAPGCIIPRYSDRKPLAAEEIRGAIQQALAWLNGNITDPLAQEIQQRYDLMGLKEALLGIHSPQSMAQFTAAQRRLSFDELLAMQLKFMQRQQDMPVITVKAPEYLLVAPFIQALPFPLTGAQQRAIAEIRSDLNSTTSMNRLVQGDVGCGKTLVAAVAALDMIERGVQVALMAPTSVLAEQHYQSFKAWFKSLGVYIRLLTGSTGVRDRREILASLKNGEIDLLIGTHALIESEIEFQSLGLAIIDEQHRFGVQQRQALMKEACHVLNLSATPIPRSLGLIAYGEMSISTIDELPPGRQEIVTQIIRYSDQGYGEVMAQLEQELRQGRQAYVILPLRQEGKSDMKDAVRTHNEVCELLPDYRVGMLHGKIANATKAQTLDLFAQGQIDVLVSTTVMEVGVNVPNATVMVILHAERFGLAQLHQLRGRVGRGEFASRCYLVTATQNSDTLERLQVLAQSNDGFFIAQQDLEMRGIGELLGELQSGNLDFRIADPIRDEQLLEWARLEALSL